MEPYRGPDSGLAVLTVVGGPEDTMGLVLGELGAELWLWFCLLSISVSGIRWYKKTLETKMSLCRGSQSLLMACRAPRHHSA